MTPEALVLCTLARHGLLDTDLPDVLDLWPVICDEIEAAAKGAV